MQEASTFTRQRARHSPLWLEVCVAVLLQVLDAESVELALLEAVNVDDALWLAVSDEVALLEAVRDGVAPALRDGASVAELEGVWEDVRLVVRDSEAVALSVDESEAVALALAVCEEVLERVVVNEDVDDRVWRVVLLYDPLAVCVAENEVLEDEVPVCVRVTVPVIDGSTQMGSPPDSVQPASAATTTGAPRYGFAHEITHLSTRPATGVTINAMLAVSDTGSVHSGANTTLLTSCVAHEPPVADVKPK
jgi:hypothetical protein